MQVKHLWKIPTPIDVINDVLGLGGWNISRCYDVFQVTPGRSEHIATPKL